MKTTAATIIFVLLFLSLIPIGSHAQNDGAWSPPPTTQQELGADRLPDDAKYSARVPQDDPITENGATVLGLDGEFWPQEGSFSTRGALVTKLGPVEKRAQYTSWDFIYSDVTEMGKSGWARCLTKGELFLAKRYLQDTPSDAYIENNFYAETVGKDHILVRLDPSKNNRLCIKHTRRSFWPTIGVVGTKIETTQGVVHRRYDGWYRGTEKVGD